MLLMCMLVLNVSWAKSGIDETIATLSLKLGDKIQTTGKKKVAVANFINNQGEETALGKFIAEEFSVELAIIAKGFSVVDRSRVSFLLKENGLTVSGLVNPKAATTLGKLSSIDALVIGTFTPYGEDLRLSVKVLDLQTADILTAARGLLARTKTITKLMTTPLTHKIATKGHPHPSNNKSDEKKTIIAKLSKSLTLDGLNFGLEKCVKIGTKMDCYFTIVALEVDNFLTLYGLHSKGYISRIYDDKGLENNAKLVSLGAKSGQRYLQRTLIANIPTKAKISFEGISRKATKIALLSLKYHSKSTNQYGTAEFRNITFLNK